MAIAFYFQDLGWRNLVVIAGGSMLVISILIYFVAESPLFLLSTNRIKEFRKVLNYIARVNNRKITKNFKKDFQKYVEDSESELESDSFTIVTSEKSHYLNDP